MISVPTPLRDGAPDLSYIEAAAATLRSRLRPGALVVLESTTYPGTTEELLRPILEADGLGADTDFFLGYSPERIDPGSTEWTFVTTPKVVSGVDDASLAAVEAFYGALVDKVVPVASTSEAELVKLLENTFRHVNIALVNELAMFARELGVDVWSAIDAAATKPFGFMRFTPGPGVGGHCLPIDPSYLAWRVERRLGTRFRFVELANEVNNHMPDYVVQRVVAMLNGEARSVSGSRILVIGLAYKPDTSDWRESPAMTIVERLQALGAHVRAHDAHVPADIPLAPGVERVACSAEELGRPTSSCCSSTTPICRTTTSRARRGSSSIRGPACEVTSSAARCCSRRDRGVRSRTSRGARRARPSRVDRRCTARGPCRSASAGNARCAGTDPT